MSARHWAAGLIGLPWSAVGEGPDAFSCWGLVRWVFRIRHGVLLPMVADESNAISVRDVMQASHRTGWRPVIETVPRADDVVLMRNAIRLHVGIVVATAAGAIGVLHCTEAKGVVWEDWAGAIAGMQVELWRRRA